MYRRLFDGTILTVDILYAMHKLQYLVDRRNCHCFSFYVRLYMGYKLLYISTTGQKVSLGRKINFNKGSKGENKASIIIGR